MKLAKMEGECCYGVRFGINRANEEPRVGGWGGEPASLSYQLTHVCKYAEEETKKH